METNIKKASVTFFYNGLYQRLTLDAGTIFKTRKEIKSWIDSLYPKNKQLSIVFYSEAK